MSQQLRKIEESIKRVVRSVTVAMVMGLLVGIPGKVTAQPQRLQSAQQSAALEEAKRVDQQALQYYTESKLNAAIPLAERALVIREKVLGKEHPDVADSVSKLAELYRDLGNYQKAEPLFQRALAIREKILGKKHPNVAGNLFALALLYFVQGNYQKAEPLLLRALAIREKLLGKEHFNNDLFLAPILNLLAKLYVQQGSYHNAEPLLLRVLAIGEKANESLALPGKENSFVTPSLNELAELYWLQGKYQKAEPLLLRALAIEEKSVVHDSLTMTLVLNNLALLYSAQDDISRATDFLRRGLAVEERNFTYISSGSEQTKQNFARSFVRSTNFAISLLLQQAPNNVEVARLALATVLRRKGRVLHAVADNVQILRSQLASVPETQQLFEQWWTIQKQQSALVYREQATQTSQAYQKLEAERERIEEAISAKSDEFRNQTQLVELKQLIEQWFSILQQWLSILQQQSALVYERQGTQTSEAFQQLEAEKERLKEAISPKISEFRNKTHPVELALSFTKESFSILLQRLSIQSQLSALMFMGQGTQTTEAFQQQEELEKAFQPLEAELSRLEEAIRNKIIAQELRHETQPVELKDIQSKIPRDAALVEIVQYQPFNPKAKKNYEKWGNPRYAATVLRSQGEPKWIDLGEAAAINNSVANLRTALKQPLFLKQVQGLARRLDEQIMAPIRPLLGNVRQVLLSPDGQLTLIPFEALVDEQGQYLIQRYAFSYLTSGRDLLRFESPTKTPSSPLVLAGIDYGQAQTVAAIPKPTSVRRSQNLRSADLANLVFDPLDATEEEAVAIKGILPNAKVLLGKEATETTVKQLHAPSILHLATHGFFLSDQEQNLNPSLKSAFRQQNSKVLQLENPLLRSGLALANVNNRNKVPAGSDDGVLTALEVAGLDLPGTQLVVLSACDTGKGDIKVGEGVYGLRRALVIAGSQTQVLSLWKVSDPGTKELMTKYYQKLKAGKGRHEALRQAQLELLNDPNYQHPYFWASFVPSGNWTPLTLEQQA